MFLFQQRKQLKKKSDEELLNMKTTVELPMLVGIFYERYAHYVMGTCMKYLKDPQESEDMTMHVFEQLAEKLLKHEIHHFKSWLYMVTKNNCFMLLRKQHSTLRMERLTDGHILKAEPDQTEQALEKEREFALLNTLLSELKEEQRHCVELFYLNELSYQEISLQLRIPLKQVRSAIQNGKRNLKIRMDEQKFY